MTTLFVQGTVIKLYPSVKKVFLRVQSVKSDWSAAGISPKNGVVVIELDYTDSAPCSKGDEVHWKLDLGEQKGFEVSRFGGMAPNYFYQFSGNATKTEAEERKTTTSLGELVSAVLTNLLPKRRQAANFF